MPRQNWQRRPQHDEVPQDPNWQSLAHGEEVAEVDSRIHTSEVAGRVVVEVA